MFLIIYLECRKQCDKQEIIPIHFVQEKLTRSFLRKKILIVKDLENQEKHKTREGCSGDSVPQRLVNFDLNTALGRRYQGHKTNLD